MTGVRVVRASLVGPDSGRFEGHPWARLLKRISVSLWEAGFRALLYLTFRSLTFQVLLTLNTLKNKQKASLEEGKCAFIDYVMVVRECGRQPFYKSHRVISWAHHYLAFRFRFLYCSVWSYWVTEFRWCTRATVDPWALDKLCSNNNKINKEKKTPQFVL